MLKASLADYNRMLAYDSDTVPVTRLGYNGSRAFYTATGFTAPADGFQLSHVQNWFVPSDWLNSKIKVMVLAGDEDINSCKTLISESFNYSVPETDETGSMLTHKLTQSVKILPNEKFYIVFGFEAALTYPQGCSSKTEVVANRFLFGQPEDWYDLANYNQFKSIGWMTRAIEETAGDVPWVVLSSANSGTLEPAHTDQISLDFTARSAENPENLAYLVAKSNDIKTPEKKVVLRLIKNKGPVFDVPLLPMTVKENDSITFMVTAFDQETDPFTLMADSAYRLLQQVNYTDPDPLKKTMKYVYKPDFNSQGMHTFSFTATDQYGYVSKASVSVTVNNMNRIPTPVSIDTLRFSTYGNYKIMGPYDLFTDPDNDLQEMEAVSGDESIMKLFVSGSSFLMMPGASGVNSVTFMVTDKFGAKATSTIPVLVSELVTGIGNDNTTDLILYPNPTLGEVHAILPSAFSGKVTLTVYTAQGIAVKEEEFSTGSFNKYDVDLSALPAGLYFLKWNNNNMQQTSRLIKQ
jgi:hypothetical protein